MERNANYALVGFATLILSVISVVFVVWLARLSFNREYQIYDILFVGPVRGLSDGGEVHFNGIKVGEVTKIVLDRRDPNRVIATARLSADVPVKTDSFATLEPMGVTGVNYVQISAGKAESPLLRDVTPRNDIPVIRTQPSAISDLLQGGGTVLTRTIEALDRINKVLSDENVETFGAAISDIQALTAEARERKAIIADAQKALQSLDQTAQDFSALAKSGQGLVDGDAKRTMANLNSAAEEIKLAAKDARGLVSGLQGPTSDFATTGLPQLSAAIITLQSAAESLERLTNQVEQNPRGLVSKAPAKTIEVKP